MNVYIPAGNITDMQGPAPDGFHVPSKKEWKEVVSIMGDLGLGESISNYKTYLYLPTAYSRGWTDGEKSSDINNSYYWCSEGLLNENGNRGYGFSTYLIAVTSNVSTSGQFIRPFKDMPVTPDSSWTALYSDKIYHNSTLGLISLSSDGTNWITIADKSLGATTVYNNGDTLSESNCGKYYQRGNNYGFPFSGSITTSTTKVNASTYGPGNYYLSSTFICGTTSPLNWGWDSSNNLNLRGGVTGPGGESELKNAYIGDGWWKLSTDFTQYTSLAQIQAQGWTGTTYSTSTSPTFSYGSNGIGVYNPSSGGKHGGIYVKLPNKITAQNKVVMKYTGTVSQIDGGIYMTLSTYNRPDLQASTQADFSYSQSYRSSASGQGLGISKNVNGTKSWGFWQDGRTIQGTAGTYEVEVRLDMPNSKAKWICTSPSGMAYTSEATISSAGIASIIGMEYFIIWGVQYSSGITNYIRSGEIAVI